ncbi:O-antigen ligase family protein [Corallococcus sp. CA053C]|uniref:O-antigen ligase family protein n=1 Tax=Corallococcus sp. CA053C TaxID=2316732 RepID=UPI0013159750|nr:O-antigen ligase family protein [Corallococcus sp. CA053C]
MTSKLLEQLGLLPTEPFAWKAALARPFTPTLWAVIATVTATALAVSPDATNSPLKGLGLVIPKHLAFAAGAVTCAFACASTWRHRSVGITTFDLAALGYLAAGFLAMAANGFSAPFSLPWLALQLSAFVTVATACEAAGKRRDALADGLVGAGVIVALIALHEASGGKLLWELARRPGATFANRNAVGGYCAILVPMALARATLKPHPLRTFAASTLLLTVALCRARSSWMGLLVAGLLATAALIELKRRGMLPVLPRSGLISACIAALVAAAALNAGAWAGLRWKDSAPLKSSVSRMLEYDSGTGLSRVEQHQVGLAMLSAQPLFGFGPGRWRREAPRFAHAATQQHARFIGPLWNPASDLLRHAVETGLFGLAAAAAMALSLLVGARRRVTQGRDLLTLATLGSLVVALVISGFDALLTRPPSVALVAAVAGMLRSDCDRRVEFSSSWAGIWVSLAAVASVCISAPRYLALKSLSEDFSSTAVLRLGRFQFPPLEALLVIMSARREGCSTLAPAAAVVDTYLPNEPNNLLVLARCAEQQGQWSTAADYLRRAHAIEPHDPGTELQLKDALSRESSGAKAGEARP